MSLTLNSRCAASRPTAEVDGEELSWVQSSVDEVIAVLQQSPGLPSVPEVSGWFVSLFFDSVTCDCVGDSDSESENFIIPDKQQTTVTHWPCNSNAQLSVNQVC